MLSRYRYWRLFEVLCHHPRFGNKIPTSLICISWENSLIRCHLIRWPLIKVFVSRECLWKDCSTKAWLFLVRSRPLWYWSISPFISCGSKEATAKGIGCLVTLSLLVLEGMDLRFRRINSGVFGQGVCRVSTNFVNWVLIGMLVYITKQGEGGWLIQ